MPTRENSEDNNKFFNKFNLWIKNIKSNWLLYLFRISLYLLPIIVINTNINSFITKHFIVFIIALIIILIFNEIMTSKQVEEITSLTSKYKDLNDEHSELERYSESMGLYLENLPNEFLSNISKFLKLKNSERISFYVLNGDMFRIIGRYSENPKFDRIGRKQYPIDKGYIAKCLENDNGEDFFCRKNLPKNDDKYLKTVAMETGMGSDEIKKLSMKSRFYFTKVIKDANNKNVGILVIESKNNNLNFRIKDKILDPKDFNVELDELIVPQISIFLNVSNKLKGDVFNG